MIAATAWLTAHALLGASAIVFAHANVHAHATAFAPAHAIADAHATSDAHATAPALAPALAQLAEPRLATARTSAIAFASSESVIDALTCDVDGDDVADLVVGTSDGKRRRLSIHLRRASDAAFVSEPAAALDLTVDVVAYAFADVEGDAARECVLFNAAGAVVWRWREKDEAKRFARLFACELLWQQSGPRELFHGQGWVRDVDGDQLEDFVVPGPSTHRIARQTRAADGVRSFAITAEIVVPEERASGRARFSDPSQKREMSISVGDDGISFDARRSSPTTWLALTESVPAAVAIDWDGDRDLDLVALGPQSVFAFAQGPAGVFAREPLSVKNPVPVDRARSLDVSYAARLRDLDGDLRADLVLFAGDQRADAPRTQVLVYKRGEDGALGKNGAPHQLLALDGFARPVQIDDVDGDGALDLVVAALKPSLLAALASGGERVDLELSLFRGGPGGFSRRADLVHKVSVEAGSGGLEIDFVGDVDGDRVRDLFVRAAKGRVAIHLVKRSRDGLSISADPAWTLDVDEKSRVLLPDRLAARTPDLFVLGKEGVRCASFR